MTGWSLSLRRAGLVLAAVLVAGSAYAQPTVDGTLDDPEYVSAATALNTNGGFGPDISVTGLLYYVDAIEQRLYIGLTGKLNTLSNDGIGLLLGFSELDGRPAGQGLAGSVPNAGHYLGAASFAAAFDVDYGFAINPGSSNNTVYFDVAKFVPGGGAAHYLGSTDQSGTAVAGPASATDNSGNPGFFSQNSVAFAFNNAGDPDTGLEVSIPFADLGITGEEALAITPSTFQAFAFVVSSTGYFSNVTVPGDVTSGNSGFNPDYNANLTGASCSCSSPSAAIGTGPFVSAALSLAAEPTYVVTSPSAGAVIESGRKTIVRWSGDGVPTRTDSVNVYLRDGAGALTFLATGRNTGKLKVTVPAGLASASDFSFVVRRRSNAAVFGESAAVSIYSPDELYTFAEPDAGESWARGFTRTVLWTAPETGPTGGTVTLTLLRDNGTVVFTATGEPDDGSYDYAIPSNLATGSGLYFTVTSEVDAVYFGRSAAFDIVRIEPTAPAEGSSWAVGSSQTVTWNPSGANAAGVVRLSLRGVSNGYSRALAIGVPFTDGTRTVTVPSTGSVPPAGEYFVQLLYTYTPPGGVETRYVSNSNRFTVTNPLSPAVVARHFAPVAQASPLAGEGTQETVVVVRGLSEGAEVGAFATTADGTEVLLSSGVVEGGEAVLAVSSDGVAGDVEVWFGAGAAASLRSFADGVARTLESSVTLSSGAVVVVDASKDASSGTPSVASVATVVPNPTSGAASVRFALPSSEAVTVTVYDALGRAVSTVYDGVAPSGSTSVSVPSSLPPGVYVVRIVGSSSSSSARFTVVR